MIPTFEEWLASVHPDIIDEGLGNWLRGAAVAGAMLPGTLGFGGQSYGANDRPPAAAAPDEEGTPNDRVQDLVMFNHTQASESDIEQCDPQAVVSSIPSNFLPKVVANIQTLSRSEYYTRLGTKARNNLTTIVNLAKQ